MDDHSFLSEETISDKIYFITYTKNLRGSKMRPPIYDLNSL